MDVDPRIDVNMVRTRQDTLAIDSLVTNYLNHLKKQNFDSALDMLFELSDDSIIALTEKSRQEQTVLYQSYPVVGYTIDSLFLYSETDTELHYTITLFNKDTGDNRPNTMRFQLLPRRIDGTWKLLIKGRSIVR